MRSEEGGIRDGETLAAVDTGTERKGVTTLLSLLFCVLDNFLYKKLENPLKKSTGKPDCVSM